jgi:hypothetical protein
MPAIVPKNIASKNGIDFRNRRRINCSPMPTVKADSAKIKASSPGKVATTSRRETNK